MPKLSDLRSRSRESESPSKKSESPSRKSKSPLKEIKSPPKKDPAPRNEIGDLLKVLDRFVPELEAKQESRELQAIARRLGIKDWMMSEKKVLNNIIEYFKKWRESI